MSLAKNIHVPGLGTSSTKELWEKLEGYIKKGISNRLLMKRQFHILRMDENIKVSNHLSLLNDIVSKLEIIKVKIDDGYKDLIFIWYLPSFYEHINLNFMYGDETLSFGEIDNKIIYEERR